MTVNTGFIHMPQDIKTPIIQELITVMTLYNTISNRHPWIVIRTVIDGYNQADSGSVTSAVSSCTSLTPHFVCI